MNQQYFYKTESNSNVNNIINFKTSKKNPIPTFIYEIDLSTLFNENLDDVFVKTINETRKFNEAPVLYKKYNLNNKFINDDSIIISSFEHLLKIIFTSIIDTRNKIEKLPNRIGSRVLLYFPNSIYALGIYITLVLESFLKENSNTHLKELTIVYETSDILDCVIENIKVHRIYNAIDISNTNKINQIYTDNFIKTFDKIAMRKPIGELLNIRKKVNNGFEKHSLYYELIKKNPFTNNTNLKSIYNERNNIINFFNNIDPFARILIRFYSSKKLETSFNSNSNSNSNSNININNEWYNDKWVYEYYLNKNSCVRGRLFQKTGTCWLNSILNVLFLTEEIRDIIRDKWINLSSPEIMEICNNDMIDCGTNEFNNYVIPTKYEYDNLVEIIRPKLYQLFHKFYYTSSELRCEKTDYMTKLGLIIIGMLKNDNKLLNIINNSNKSLLKTDISMYEGANTSYTVIPIIDAIFDHSDYAIYGSNLELPEFNINVKSQNINNMIIFTDINDEQIKPENFLYNGFQNVHLAIIKSVYKKPPKLLVINMPIRISSGLGATNFAQPPPMQKTFAFISSSSNSKSKSKSNSKYYNYNLVASTLNLTGIKYGIKDGVHYAIDKPIRHSIMCSHCDDIYYIYDSNNLLTEYNWNERSINDVFNDYEKMLQKKNYGLTKKNVRNINYDKFQINYEIEHHNVLFYCLE